MKRLFVLLMTAALCAQRPPGTIGKSLQEFWEWQLANNPDYRLKRGPPIDKLPDVTFEKAQADAAFARRLLDRLNKVRKTDLPHDEQLSYDALEFELRHVIEGPDDYWFQFPVTPYTSPIPGANRCFTLFRFRNSGDLKAYLDLLNQYPSFLDRIQNKLEAQARKGIRLPKPEIELVRGFLSGYLKAPAHTPFYVVPERLAGLDTADFRRNVDEAIRSRIQPRFRALIDAMGGDYERLAPQGVGFAQYPGGRAYYRSQVKFHTTLDISPEEVHRIGLAAVKDTEARMEAVRAKLGYAGRSQEFSRFVKTDPRFFPKRPEEMQEKMEGFLHRIEPLLASLFLRMPRAPYGIRRLDPALESSQTFGIYHQPSATEPKGIYYFNGSDLTHRTMINAGVLIYHELVPGHHLQMNRQRENDALPEFRRYGFYTAHGEGWGCYATVLADELGMYQDPYDLYGYLAMNMFYSVRLVVDTGMNYLGWTRERASQYMAAHLLETDAQIATETLRYAVDYPGQALAYRMGERKFEELRERARRALGARFDVRRFHEWILEVGAVPLPVLEKHVEWRIARAY